MKDYERPAGSRSLGPFRAAFIVGRTPLLVQFLISDERGRIVVPRDVNAAIGSKTEVLVILGFMTGVACDRKRPIEIERMVIPIRAKANARGDGRDEINVLIVVDGEDVVVELFTKRKLGIEEKAADSRAQRAVFRSHPGGYRFASLWLLGEHRR